MQQEVDAWQQKVLDTCQEVQEAEAAEEQRGMNYVVFQAISNLGKDAYWLAQPITETGPEALPPDVMDSHYCIHIYPRRLVSDREEGIRFVRAAARLESAREAQAKRAKRPLRGR